MDTFGQYETLWTRLGNMKHYGHVWRELARFGESDTFWGMDTVGMVTYILRFAIILKHWSTTKQHDFRNLVVKLKIFTTRENIYRRHFYFHITS